MKNSMTKRMWAIALVVVMLVTTCIAYTASATEGKFALDMTATTNAADNSVIDVVITVKDIVQELDAVEFNLNFDKRLVAGVITQSGSAMDAFMTVTPMYTLAVSGNEIPTSRYEQICVYDAANGRYECRFADLLEYSYAKEGETYNGLINDGDLVITIQFKLLDGVAAGTKVSFSATDVKGTTTSGVKSVVGSEASAVCTVTEKETVAIPTITGKSFSLSFESEILVNFYYTVSDVSDVVEQGMLVFNSNPGTANYATADQIYNNPGYDSSTSMYMATTTGIAAKEMGDTRYYAGYAKLSDGSYTYSALYQYSPKKYATNMLAKSSTSEGQKALCVAMLNYGAAAQNYFGYRTSDLMNAVLTAEQKAMVVAYDASYFTGAVAANSSKTVNFTKTSTGFSSRSATVSFEGALAINYYFAPSATISGNLTLYYWTPEDYAAASVLTKANASGSCAMVASGDGSYWGQVSGIAAKYLDETYYVAGVYTDASGNTYCTGVIAYSLSRYCLNNAKDGNSMQELAAATAMYGYYAKAYFANK